MLRINNQTVEYILSFICAFGIAFILSPKILPALIKLKCGQEIRQEGPKAHLSKAGTPTMGGIVFIISIIITTLIINHNNIIKSVYLLLFVVFFTIVGFVDDYEKVINKRNLGLTGKQKLIMQIIFALVLAILTELMPGSSTQILIPFSKHKLNLGYFYIPFTMLTIVATTNSVNLTDGLDGLASSVTSIAMFAFGIIAMNMNYISVGIFSFAVSGACLGFLRINRFPAKSFMGDTGSMALGGAVSAAAIAMNMHIVILFIGIIYVIESLSVIIQVFSFKKFKKRVFKMAPFHHHLELSGLKEVKVVKIFCLVTLISSIIGILSTAFI